MDFRIIRFRIDVYSFGLKICVYQCMQVIIIVWKMSTPKQTQKSRRVHSTVDTSSHYLSKKKTEGDQKQRTCRYQQGQIEGLKRKLEFGDDWREKEEVKKPNPSAAYALKSYRQAMLSYLDSKFEQSYNNKLKQKLISTGCWKEKKKKKPQNLHVKTMFKNFMTVVRELRIQVQTQYLFGRVLKQLNFVKSLLEQRQTITSLWLDLKEPNIGQIFIFVCQLYYHINKSETIKQQLIEQVVKLFNEQGHSYSPQLLDLAFQRARLASIGYAEKRSLMNNRLSRPTMNSKARRLQDKYA